MDNIDIYNNSAIILSKKTPKCIISWVTILIILLFMSIILFCIPFNIYKKYYGYVNLKDNLSYINLLIEERDFPIYKNKKLYIKNDKYEYEIIDIKTNEIILKLDLNENLKINNNIIEINLLIERTTVFEILKTKIKKGFGV